MKKRSTKSKEMRHKDMNDGACMKEWMKPNKEWNE